MREIQLTHSPYGHMLNSNQVFSKDGKWLVYDTRNDDSKITSTGSIEMVHVDTREMKVLYRTQNQSEYGPGVGAATFSPAANRVIFIHGIRNADKNNPYGFTRRTGVAIDIATPEKPIFMDARDIIPPFTPGALRGGSHAHSWSGNGDWLSFTYNDYVIEKLSKKQPEIQDLRTVGIMLPRIVKVETDRNQENNSGEMYSLIVAAVTENPKAGSDEIDKAFDECWIGKKGYKKADGSWQEKAVAFQGNVRDEEGKTKTEVFVVDLPEDLVSVQSEAPKADKRIGVAAGLKQRRITFSREGVLGPRHWLRSSPDGTYIAFLSKDEFGIINVFVVSPNGGDLEQVTFHETNIQSGVNFSFDGKHIAYVAENSVYITELGSCKAIQLTIPTSDAEKPQGSIIWSPDGTKLAYNRYVKNEQGSYLQIFLINEWN